jgi:hypothetical protein
MTDLPLCGSMALGREKMRELERNEEEDLEEFVRDWCYDEPTQGFARSMGRFLFQFLDYLESTDISQQTLRKHRSNCWLIGKFECDYGYHKTFSPTIFLGGPLFLYEFKRKVSDSKYAVNSYTATWRKLERYVQSRSDNRFASSPARFSQRTGQV